MKIIRRAISLCAASALLGGIALIGLPAADAAGLPDTFGTPAASAQTASGTSKLGTTASPKVIGVEITEQFGNATSCFNRQANIRFYGGVITHQCDWVDTFGTLWYLQYRWT